MFDLIKIVHHVPWEQQEHSVQVWTESICQPAAEPENSALSQFTAN